MNNRAAIPPRLDKVPPFPAVAARLLGVLADPAADIGEVAELVGSDPTLTAHILKAVNSYEYALKSPVTSVRQAVALIGLDKTRQVATTAATATYVRRLMTADLLRSWHHSDTTAVLSEEIARCCGAFTHIAFVAGIIHDLGRLGLLVAYPDEYRQLLCNAEQHSLDLLDVEEQKFGVNHAEVGRMLAEAWGLPEEFRVINGRHHDSCDGTELDLLSIVHAACDLADSLGFGVTSRPPSPAEGVLNKLPPRAAARMQETPEKLTALIEERISAVT